MSKGIVTHGRHAGEPRTRVVASYRNGVDWIAFNDEPGSDDIEEIASFISTILLAALFGKKAEEVAADILRYRKKNWRDLGWTSARGNG